MRGNLPAQDWQIDFTHMPTHKKLHYLLTFVLFQAFPTSCETADMVASLLTQEIIPCFGLPATIQLDNGPAFTAQVVQLVTKFLNISWELHIPYHPQSSGKVERAHSILKDHLAKLAIEVKLSWPTLLPLAWVRATPRGPMGLSPFKLLYGRPFLVSHNLPVKPPPLASYLPFLSLLRHLLREHVDHILPVVPGPEDPHPATPLQPGDSVLRKLKLGSLQPRWSGPHIVILTTPTAAKLLGHTPWYHVSCLKLAPQNDQWAPLASASPIAPTCHSLTLQSLLLTILISPLKANSYVWCFYMLLHQ
ncbi:LOW QUALITY PROTEIN: Gag-Pol polyprotein [Plecturocebus cupreus]